MEIWIYLKKKEKIGQLEEIAGGISPERWERLSRIKNPEAVSLSLTAELLLREACREANIGGAERNIRYDDRGKPYFGGDIGYFFNISHSGEYACLAFAEREVGIDIEQIRPVRKALVRKVFTEPEQRWLAKQPEEERDMAFIRLWTRKESYGKYLGEGLSGNVIGTDLSPDKAGNEMFAEYRMGQYGLALCFAPPQDGRGTRPEGGIKRIPEPEDRIKVVCFGQEG